MPEDQNQIENVEIEPLSEDDLEGVAGGSFSAELPGDGGGTSSGPSCCSCSDCSR
ncbi:MAG TPA: hypothetical protein VGC13_04465 [Longimicrobium sp.]|jgi:hypothetical protein|uniref:hypothetical protein n=1 Tax=Longimicrobium sp. TaxID=2029185 RepID=UPI002ED842CD